MSEHRKILEAFVKKADAEAAIEQVASLADGLAEKQKLLDSLCKQLSDAEDPVSIALFADNLNIEAHKLVSFAAMLSACAVALGAKTKQVQRNV